MTENEFLLQDRITKIKSINELYNLEENGYVTFSGGKDSTVLHFLLDEALPENKIPRVYLNTGIEYKKVVAFVERERERDERIIIIPPQQNIKKMLEQYGYPFKSKEHCKRIKEYKSGARSPYLMRYFRQTTSKNRQCPKKLMYQLSPDFSLKLSSSCCDKLKKEVIAKWQKENNKSIAMTGMRKEEGGSREMLTTCTIFKDNELKKFHPLLPLTEDFIDWYIRERNIKLCDLYYPPYNFKRTGCKGCPFSLDLQKQLDIMSIYLPEERRQCEAIWKPVYEEYRRINYRLEKTLFDDL